MRFDSTDSVCIVTGASSGIGRALAERLLQRRAHVVVVARRSERLDQIATPDPAKMYQVVGDITEAKVRQQIVQVATQIRGGAVDLLVNNAGSGAIGSFAAAKEERLRKIMEVNFFAPVELTRGLLPALAKGRSPVICNISSVLGHRAVPNKSEYCASKFAIHGWSDALRAELSQQGIQVTLVSPSTTRSDFFDSLIDTDPNQTSSSFGSWSPEQVADAAISAIEKRKDEVICSLPGKLLVWADRFCPPLMNRLLRQS
ncbi:MAG: SDR family NAD(P)-dependent oxidoreductase [Rubripirellula sp.]|nr:SDR family NAD(P)-dependent oxidoreductase [Rubripirellula sp.]